MPFYCGLTEVPEQLKYGNINTFDFNANFWVNNVVANEAYYRYNQMIPDIRRVQEGLEKAFIGSTPSIDKVLAELVKSGNTEAYTNIVNSLGAAVAKNATDAYRDLAIYLFVKFMDGNTKKTDEKGAFLNSEYGLPLYPQFSGYNKAYYENIVRQTGDHFLIKE